MEAFEAEAVGYLLKPVRKEKLAAATERAQRLTQRQLGSVAGVAPRTHLSVRTARWHPAAAAGGRDLPARRTEVHHRAPHRRRGSDRGFAARSSNRSSATASCASIAARWSTAISSKRWNATPRAAPDPAAWQSASPCRSAAAWSRSSRRGCSRSRCILAGCTFEFTKMHGLGNDFIVLDSPARDGLHLARAMARARPTGTAASASTRPWCSSRRAATWHPRLLPHLQRRWQRGRAMRQRRALPGRAAASARRARATAGSRSKARPVDAGANSARPASLRWTWANPCSRPRRWHSTPQGSPVRTTASMRPGRRRRIRHCVDGQPACGDRGGRCRRRRRWPRWAPRSNRIRASRVA